MIQNQTILGIWMQIRMIFHFSSLIFQVFILILIQVIEPHHLEICSYLNLREEEQNQPLVMMVQEIIMMMMMKIMFLLIMKLLRGNLMFLKQERRLVQYLKRRKLRWLNLQFLNQEPLSWKMSNINNKKNIRKNCKRSALKRKNILEKRRKDPEKLSLNKKKLINLSKKNKPKKDNLLEREVALERIRMLKNLVSNLSINLWLSRINH